MILTVASALILGAWLTLATARRSFWRAQERLFPSPPPPAAWPKIVAIIPARDEAQGISDAIRSHMETDYPGEFCVVLVDDGSTDGTAPRARESATDARRLDVVDAPPLPPGWTGKLWAMNAGLAQVASHYPDATYLLLTDADIVHAPFTLRRLAAKAEHERLALTSLMARLDARGVWGALLIPSFVYFFQKLYPFPAVNDPQSGVAAAAGGCMLVRADALRDAGGVEAIKSKLIDDCALASLLKNRSEGHAVWLGLAENEVVSMRDNRSLSSIWRMVERTAFTQLDYSWSKVAGAVVGMLFLYLAPPVIALSYPLHGDEASGALALAAWIVMAATYFPTARLYDLPHAATASLPIAGLFYALMTASSAAQHARGAGGAWKGRTYGKAVGE